MHEVDQIFVPRQFHNPTFFKNKSQPFLMEFFSCANVSFLAERSSLLWPLPPPLKKKIPLFAERATRLCLDGTNKTLDGGSLIGILQGGAKNSLRM